MNNFYGTEAKNSSILDKEKYEKMVKKIPINPIVTEKLLQELKSYPEGEPPLDSVS